MRRFARRAPATHHGQLSIPWLGWSLASPFLEHAMGAHRRGGSQLYINPGTNYWGIPFRIGALPEVTVLTLRRSEGAASLRERDRRRRCGARRSLTPTADPEPS